MKKSCDCMQGRLPCTCKTADDKMSRLLPELQALFKLEASQLNTEDGPAVSDYWRGAAKRANDRADSMYVEYLAASSKLQIVKGLAILGWAAVILMAMGV